MSALAPRVQRIAVSLLALPLLLTACATTSRPPATAGASPLPVPFIAQRENLCGPAALAMLAAFYGHQVTQEEIAREIYLPEIGGSLTPELASYARRFGLWTRQHRGSVSDLGEKLAAGVPLIVLGRFGNRYHYFVVLADGDPLVVHTDRRAFHRMRREDFLRYWDRAGRWTLLVCPPDRTRWKLSAAEHNDLGLFLEQTADDPCAAEFEYRQAVKLQPDRGYYHFNLGNALRRQNLLEEAAASYRRALEIEPENADAMNNLAWTFHERGQHLDQAASLCRRAVQQNPAKSAFYLDTLGNVLLKQGQLQDARAAFEQALAATTDRQVRLRQSIAQRLAEMTAAE